MTAKRPLDGGGGGGAASRSPALKKRCRSFDLEIRGCRHLEELAGGVVRRLEAALESAISRIPEEVTKALTGFLSSAPSFCRTVVDQNRPPRYKLKFTNSLSNEVFTKKGVCAVNGDPLKISLEEDNQQGNNLCLLSARIKVVVLDGDFNRDDKDYWTSEDFIRHIVRPRDKVGAVLTGELDLSLKNGETNLRDATFIDNSKFMRSGKFRLGVMVVDELGERVQEGITEPFTVKDRRGEGSKKHVTPSLDDDLWRLKKISKDGVLHEALKGSRIFCVKDFLRFYYKDEHSLRKILHKATELVWTTIVDHAKLCDPGKEIYSFAVEGHNAILFFNSFYQIVGVTLGDYYTPFDGLDKPWQERVRQWSKVAYENLTCRQPDYEMDNGKPRAVDQGTYTGSSILEPKFMEGHISQQNFSEIIVHETNHQEGTVGSHSKQCTLKRVGSIRVTQNEDKQLTRLYSSSQAAQQTRLETNHEHGAAERSNTRLCFLNDLQTPIYTDKNIAAENNTAIKIGIFEGPNIIRKGPLSNIKVEVMVLRGDFSNDGQESWSEEEFNSHIVKGRYGQGFVLGGDDCVVRLTNGEASLGKLRFKEGSSRTRSRKFVLAARVCKTENTGVRVQEAVMKPVTVRDRRNEANEKRHPPKLDDDVYRLEEISKDGIYHKRLQKAHIFTVHDFLKALNKNDKKLREEVLQMRKQHNSFVKMVNHARECCLREKYDLKAYENEEGNVRLYFNCVDQLVGAEFQGDYVTQDEFDPAQKAQANKLKECAHDKLEDISFDYVMRNNFPAQICTSSNAAVAGPFFPNPSGQNMSNQGTSAAVSLGHDEVSSLAEPLLPTEEQVPLGPANSCNSLVEHDPLSDLVFVQEFDVFQYFNAFSEPDFPCFRDDAVQPLWADDDPQPSSSSFPGMFHGIE